MLAGCRDAAFPPSTCLIYCAFDLYTEDILKTKPLLLASQGQFTEDIFALQVKKKNPSDCLVLWWRLFHSLEAFCAKYKQFVCDSREREKSFCSNGALNDENLQMVWKETCEGKNMAHSLQSYQVY